MTDRRTEPAVDNRHDREQLWDLIKDIKFAMFTTRHANGHLHSRPMTTQNRGIDEDASLWFFMSRRGDAVADIAADPAVCPRRSNFDPPCRLNFDPGLGAGFA